MVSGNGCAEMIVPLLPMPVQPVNNKRFDVNEGYQEKEVVHQEQMRNLERLLKLVIDVHLKCCNDCKEEDKQSIHHVVNGLSVRLKDGK